MDCNKCQATKNWQLQLKLTINGPWQNMGEPECEGLAKRKAGFWRKGAPEGGSVRVVEV